MLVTLEDAAATEAAGEALGKVLPREGLVVYLQGDLGAGKTTLVRGLLQALGHAGRVPSPTYTLVEPYELAGRDLKHLDLYRIADPEELEFLGVREMEGIVLIEWPERGKPLLPPADLSCQLTAIPEGRRLEAAGLTAQGRAVCLAWGQAFRGKT